MKYKNWVRLNDEGMKELGHIFKDGTIPTVNIMIPSRAVLEGGVEDKEANVWKIDISKLKPDIFEMCLEYISKKRNADKEEVRKGIVGLGFIPIQEKWVSSAGTSQMGAFL